MKFPNIYRNISRLLLPSYSGLVRIGLVLVTAGASLAFVTEGQPTALSRPFEQRISKTPEDAHLSLEYAGELAKTGQTEEAREQIMGVLNFDPVNPYALRFYNELNARSADLENEIKLTREILYRRPDYQKAWARLATLYEYEGQTDLANEARQKAEALAKKL
ncbi:hypothetical protein HYW40_01060 [Candidatus Curtissbacteria bacterium]|nr:hypothetical protein [Candidatus Curtissbacteria bacterium]